MIVHSFWTFRFVVSFFGRPWMISNKTKNNIKHSFLLLYMPTFVFCTPSCESLLIWNYLSLFIELNCAATNWMKKSIYVKINHKNYIGYLLQKKKKNWNDHVWIIFICWKRQTAMRLMPSTEIYLCSVYYPSYNKYTKKLFNEKKKKFYKSILLIM